MMIIKTIFLTVFACVSISIIGQAKKIELDKNQYSDSIKTMIINNDYSGVLKNLNTLDIDTNKLKVFISEYSHEINSNNYAYNEFQSIEGSGPTKSINAYGYRWSTAENCTFYTIRIATVINSENTLKIKNLEFISHDKKLMSQKFPGGEINIQEIPPPVAPPPSFSEK